MPDDHASRPAYERATLATGVERAAALLACLPEIVVVLEPGGTVRYANDAATAILGYSVDEKLGTSVFDLVHPDDLATATEALVGAAASRSGPTEIITLRIRDADGSWRRVEVTANNRLDDPEIGGIVVTAREVEHRLAHDDVLRETERRLNAAFDGASIGMALVSLEGRYLRVNRALCELLGYEAEELLRKHVADVTHPEDRVADLEVIDQLLTDEIGTHVVEKRYVRADGTHVWARRAISLVRDDAGVPMYLASQVIDVSDRIEAESALRASEERYRQIVELAAEGIATYDGDDVTTFVNQSMAAMLGYDPCEMIGRSLLDFVDADVQASATEHLARRHSRIREQRYELRLRHRDGHPVWVEISATPITTSDGRFAGGMALVADVTDRREAATALREVQQRFRAAFERSPVGIALITPESTIVEVNPAYCALVGREASALVGTSALEFVNPEHRDQVIQAAIRRPSGGAASTPEPIRITSADGRQRWILWDSSIVTGEAGEVQYLVVLAVDVTEQRRVQEALHRSELWFRALVQHSSDIVTVVDPDGVLQYVSPSAHAILGFQPDELVGRNGRELIHADDYEGLARAIARQLEHGRDHTPVEYRQRRRDGSWAWFEATASVLPAEVGTNALVINARDISERKQGDAERAALEARFQAAFATSPVGIAFVDLEGQLAWVNDSLAEMIGVSKEQLLDTRFDAIPGEASDFDYELAEVRRLLADEIASFTSERRYKHPNGRVEWGLLYISLVRDASGAPKYVLVQAENITDRKERELELAHDAEHDVLTGLWNRAGLRRLLTEAWAQRSPDEPLALLFVDLDGFKEVNDTRGHKAGDEVLVHVAHRLRQAVRGGDAVARWGGDEFVVVCNRVRDVAEAELVATRICGALGVPFAVAAGEVAIGASVGVAVDDGSTTPQRLLTDADTATYQAKRGGRGGIALAPMAQPSQSGARSSK